MVATVHLITSLPALSFSVYFSPLINQHSFCYLALTQVTNLVVTAGGQLRRKRSSGDYYSPSRNSKRSLV